MGIEEKRQPRGEVVDRQAMRQGGLDVGQTVRESEGDLLHRGRAGLAHVIAGDRDGVPARHPLGAEGDDVGDQPERVARWVDVGAAGGVLLQDVVLDRAPDLLPGDALLLGDHQIERQQDGGGRVDGHRGGDPVQRDALEQPPHVLDGVDRHPHPPDLATGERMVGVVADLGRQVEGHRQAGGALRQQVTVAPVGLFGAGVTRVLAHGPVAPPVHVRVDAAGERLLARVADLAPVIDARQVGRPVGGGDGDAGGGLARAAGGARRRRGGGGRRRRRPPAAACRGLEGGGRAVAAIVVVVVGHARIIGAGGMPPGGGTLCSRSTTSGRRGGTNHNI